jgi:hypothetical protein
VVIEMPWILIDANSTIANVIEYDGASEYTPPEGQTLVNYQGAVQVSPGFHWNGTDPVPPNPPKPEPAVTTNAPPAAVA